VTELLVLDDLKVALHVGKSVLPALDGVSLTVKKGKTLAIVGESGCGKSMTALTIMRLLPTPPARIASGRILFEGEDLAQLPEGRLMSLRGREISMIFQDPMTSLNPVIAVGDQIIEVLRTHTVMKGKAVERRAVELLELVGIPNAAARMHEFPHRLSGGMNQRVMIAMAIACNPKLLIADEPTTALDVTIQAQILELLRDIQQARGMGLLLITHDLGVVAEMADEVVVMYAGKIVERATVDALFEVPLHPYTRGLLGATPSAESGRCERLADIPGMVPPLFALPQGCAFAARCSRAIDRCRVDIPPLVNASPVHSVACFVAEPSVTN
jgi:oligopeptide/dipeptide ABC transporter ATP-binding protein